MTTASRKFLDVLVLGIGWWAGACHESTPETVAQVPDGELAADKVALACEADLSCPGGGICDPTTLRCLACRSDADCTVGVCAVSSGVCVQCVDDGDCAKGVCHPTRNICVGCWQDADCAGTDPTTARAAGVCHPELLSCVECLDDADCGTSGGRCNLETFGCIGGCTFDAQCADNDACTVDACKDGVCSYTKTADGCGCASVTFACPPDAVPTDSDGDRCDDACLCDDGQVVEPGARCACPEPPACPAGTKLGDTDRDGCFDACVCANGALLQDDGTCPCASDVACEGGLVPSDLDGDGCPETCTKPCASDCDCEAQGLVATVPCPLACATCGPFLVCDGGVCQGRCGPDNSPPCACPPPPACGPLETAIDKDLDGCNDSCECLLGTDAAGEACRCPFAIGCDEGSTPVDTNEDGCADRCVCIDPNRKPAPDGSCCQDLVCPAGAVPVDKGGDACADVCVCADGSVPTDADARCPCREKSVCLELGAEPVDVDQDGCVEGCVCANGKEPGPEGCGACLVTCADLAVPAQAYYVDEDGDGCYDSLDACPVGQRAAKTANAGCPDTCVACDAKIDCPARASAIDSDGDNCPDTCLCEGGVAVVDGACPCAVAVDCAAPAYAIDRDSDGCADGCAVPCSNACDCDLAMAEPTFAEPACAADCVGCTVKGQCVEGLCAFACAQVAVVAACPVSPDSATAVCGCNDVTYASACEATKAGVEIKREGSCEASGCTADTDCIDGQFCELPAAGCLALASNPAFVPVALKGECQAIPDACIGVESPVCGCDGKTYDSDCERRKAAVAKAADGKCP